MCIYDTTRFSCTGEVITLMQRCPFPEACVPHIRQVLYRMAVCHLCAVAGLEAGAVVMVGRDGGRQYCVDERGMRVGGQERNGGEGVDGAGGGGAGEDLMGVEDAGEEGEWSPGACSPSDEGVEGEEEEEQDFFDAPEQLLPVSAIPYPPTLPPSSRILELEIEIELGWSEPSSSR